MNATNRPQRAHTYPVEDVKRPVRPQKENVVPVEVLHFAEPLQHDELRHDRNRLEENRKGPQNFNQFEVVAAQQGGKGLIDGGGGDSVGAHDRTQEKGMRRE